MSVASMTPYNNAITSNSRGGGGGGGNNNAIANNDNENSIDPNPYVFPYFHADGTTPLLYELVVTHFGNHHTTATGVATATTTTTSIPQSSLNMFTSNAKMARRLKSRCLVRPIEAGWADSCGDTVLHRLSQLVRFDLDDVSHYFTNDGTFLDIGIGATRSKSRNGSGDGDGDGTSSRGLLSCSPPNRIPCASSPKSVNGSTMTPGMTNADLILLTQRYLMEAEPKAVYAVNNWGETYLHQFVSHCGFSIPSSSLSATTASIMKEEEESSSQPSMCYLETLLQAFPESACRGNYLKALPLHEACGLPQLESNNNNTRTNSIFSTTTTSSSSSLDAVEKFGKYLRNMILVESSSLSSSLPNYPNHMKRTATTTTMENHHLRIIQRLLEYYPVGAIELDAVGRSPLCRAIQSKYCSSDVVLTLLEEMEAVLERNVVRSCCTCNSCESCSSVSLLLRAAILGQKAVVLNTTSIDNTVKVDEGDDCSVGSCDSDDDDTHKSLIVSPLEELWNIWLEPKNGLEHLYWWIDHHNPQTFPTLPTESSISQMVEACLHIYPFPTTTTEGALKEFRKKEQMVASHLLCKLGHLWKKACHLMLTVYKGSVSTQSSSNPRHRHRRRQNSNNDAFMFEADVEEEEGEKSKECISGEGGLVHAAILCSSPRCILNLATRMYPEELIAVDEDGNTPLCMLLSSSDFWRTDWYIGNRMNANNYKEGSEMSILNCILWSNPHAAGIVNRQGRLPLHLALSRGLQWYNGICDIFYANPSAVSIHDPITKLFPFMQVAVTDCDKTESEKANVTKVDGDVDHILTTTFELLRADPAVLLQSNVFF